jgi:imidazolonepropionase-like amidohydrolase
MRTFSALSLAFAAAAATAGAQTTVITGVTVIAMDREAAIPNQTVVIEGSRIASVGSSAATPAGATVVDGRGKFLMPGLAEFHAHVPSGGTVQHADRTLKLYVLAGVTTARGMLGAPMHLAVRDSIARGQRIGPRLFTSGPSFNGQTAPSAEVAMNMVRAQKEAGYDLLKIHPGLTRATFDSMAAAANRAGITFSGHVPLEVPLDVAISAKYSTIDHLDGFIEAMCTCSSPYAGTPVGFFGLGLMNHLDDSKFQGIVARVKASGVAMVPTQILMDNYTNDLSGDSLTALPEMRYWIADGGLGRTAWKNQKNTILAQGVPKEQRVAFTNLRRRFIKALHDAGVPFLLGSDAPQLWNVPGFSTHRELEALVAAGLTPYQALRTGTANIAAYLKEEGRSGVIRAGARADLILLDANPLANVSNTQRIAGVVVNGKWISGAERERLLAELIVP